MFAIAHELWCTIHGGTGHILVMIVWHQVEGLAPRSRYDAVPSLHDLDKSDLPCA
jgi:hypothetical protein